MPAPPQRRGLPAFVAAAVLALLLVFIRKNGIGSLHRFPGWTVDAINLKLSPEDDASAGTYYDRTRVVPLPLAAVIREMRTEWPTMSLALIHSAALEVGTALLHRSDIEAGEMIEGKFVPSPFPPWHINERMIAEVTASPTLFENDKTYVFRRK